MIKFDLPVKDFSSRRRFIKEVLMKDLMKNIAVFIFLTFAVSSFVACTNSASSQKDSADNANSAASKSSEFPPAPAMQAEIKDIDGNSFKLEDKKGKVILVNLWAIYCAPCREEMPEFVALQDKFRDKNFEIVGLDTDESDTPEAIKAFAQKMKLNYQLGYADEKIMNDFLKISKFGGIPQSYLIDREGKLRGVFLGGGAANVGKIKDSVEKVVNE